VAYRVGVPLARLAIGVGPGGRVLFTHPPVNLENTESMYRFSRLIDTSPGCVDPLLLFLACRFGAWIRTIFLRRLHPEVALTVVAGVAIFMVNVLAVAFFDLPRFHHPTACCVSCGPLLFYLWRAIVVLIFFFVVSSHVSSMRLQHGASILIQWA